MTLDPLLASGPMITSHVAAAAIAVLGGAVQLITTKGTQRHRIIGYLWVSAMVYICLSSFFIHTLRMIGPFSPIHLISIATLVLIVRAVQFARSGQIKAHESAMKALYIFALILTGTFTLLPGRIMHLVVFG